MTDVRIIETGSDVLHTYGEIPIVFEVTSILTPDPEGGGLGGIQLKEEPVILPYMKDYDDQGEGGPERWPERFDATNWGFLLALDGERRVGGAVLACDTPGCFMLAGRRDLAVLWDIRVHPDFRGRGIGTRLFDRSVEWARTRGCAQLKIETQNVNVPACRFYAKRGCHLGEVNLYAYAGHPEVGQEAMLIWYVDL